MEKDFNYKTVLITGGAGFIGSNVATYLQSNYPHCTIVVFDVFKGEQTYFNTDVKSFGHYNNLIEFKGDVICGDINNSADLNKLKIYNFDYILHFAAISDTRVYDQELVLRTNVNSFYNIIKIAEENKAKIIYASSAATYGSSPPPQKNGDESPESLYGFSKYAMDQIAYRHMKENTKIHIVGLKFFNVYGEKEYYKKETSSMIIQLAHQILAGKSPRLFNGSDKIKRDFVYIKDVVNAIILACFSKQNGIYNIGSGQSRSFYDIVTILQHELGINSEIEYFKNPYSVYQMNTKADISQSQQLLDYQPKYSLEKGIKEYIPYIRKSFNQVNFL